MLGDGKDSCEPTDVVGLCSGDSSPWVWPAQVCICVGTWDWICAGVDSLLLVGFS